jgi:hypothetical protein
MAPTLPSHRAAVHLRLVALLHVGRFLTLLATFTLAIVAMAQDDPRWLGLAGTVFIGWIAFALLHLAEAGQSRWTVCSAPLLERTSCAKHPDASRFLGSYRLHTALQILGTSAYDCRHCGERVCCRGQRGRSERNQQEPLPSGTLPARRNDLATDCPGNSSSGPGGSIVR